MVDKTGDVPLSSTIDSEVTPSVMGDRIAKAVVILVEPKSLSSSQNSRVLSDIAPGRNELAGKNPISYQGVDPADSNRRDVWDLELLFM